jgi:hypothetical protein
MFWGKMEKWGKFINPQKTRKKSNRKYASEILILILKNVFVRIIWIYDKKFRKKLIGSWNILNFTLLSVFPFLVYFQVLKKYAIVHTSSIAYGPGCWLFSAIPNWARKTEKECFKDSEKFPDWARNSRSSVILLDALTSLVYRESSDDSNSINAPIIN